MAVLRLTEFAGMQPSRDPRQLPDNAAAEAANLHLDDGAIRGIGTPDLIQAVGGTTRRVYRIPVGTPITDLLNSYWWEFSDPDTDVVKSVVVNDSYERHYYASPSTGPKYNTEARILLGQSPYILGIPMPTTAPTFASITGGVSATNVTRSYLVTFESAYGEEGQPSDTVESTGKTDDTWTVNIPQPTAGQLLNRNITNINIYRTITAASGTTTFYRVTQVAVGTLTYADTLTDSVVSANTVLESTTWAEPPTTLSGLIAMPNGILVGFVGNNLYFSENYRPHAWPAEYILTVEYPIVGLGVFGNTAVVLTQGHPAAVTGVRSSAMNLVTNTAPKPCLSRGSIVSTPQGVLYASEDGLVLFGPGGIQDVTRDLIDRDTWSSEYLPATLRAVFVNGLYTAVRSTGSDEDGFFFDPLRQQLGVVTLENLGDSVDIGVDVWSGRPWLIVDDNLYEWLPPNAASLTWRWKSKEFHIEKPMNLGVAQVFFNNVSVAADCHLKVWYRNESNTQVLIYDENIGDIPGKEFRLPGGYKSDHWQFELSGIAEVYGFHVASTVAELRGV